jgi:hypothetical protein
MSMESFVNDMINYKVTILDEWTKNPDRSNRAIQIWS